MRKKKKERNVRTKNVTTGSGGNFQADMPKGAEAGTTNAGKEGTRVSEDVPEMFRMRKGVTKSDFSL